MNIRAFLVSHSQTSPLEQPIEAGLHNISEFAQSTAVRSIPFGDQGPDSIATQGFADLGFCIVGSVCQQKSDASSTRAAGTADVRPLFNDRHCELRIMDVCSRVTDRPRDSRSVGQQVTFRPCFATIRRVRAGVRPPKTARIEQLSSTATSRFNWPACPSSSNKSCHTRAHKPDSCQSRSRRQQVIPEPQPISWGRYSQGVPVLSTNRMPVRQARSDTRGLPPKGLGHSCGSSGAIRSQSSSGSKGFAMRSSLTETRSITFAET
jgi:hypothetical protein